MDAKVFFSQVKPEKKIQENSMSQEKPLWDLSTYYNS